tara:strand:- start:2115 stop:2558 length:444 start_codon:yes stop_codon:yes gene_type:complete
MQTFLPEYTIEKSLRHLDDKRLGKQRVEAMQLVNCHERLQAARLTDPDARVPWCRHPAYIMWSENIPALKWYHNLAIDEWERRGFRNTMTRYRGVGPHVRLPEWWYDHRMREVVRTHRANLMRKEPLHYIQYGWKCDVTSPYYWPTP